MTTKIPVELSSTPGIVDGSNATAITIDSSENIGIGTSSPNAKLEVTGSSDGDLTSAIFANTVQGGTNDTVAVELQLAGTSGQVAASTLRAGKGEDWTSGTSRSGFLAIEAVLDGTNRQMAYFGSDGDGSSKVSFSTNNSERMRIDSSGNIGIGTSSPAAELHINDTGGLSRIRLTGTAANADDFEIGQGVTGVQNNGFSIYDVNESATRLMIDSDGNLIVGTTTRLNNSNTIAKTTDHVPLNLRRDNGASDNSIFLCYKSTSTAVLAIRGDGDIENTNNAYGALSDERLKSNIVDANSQLEDIKKVKVRNYTLDSTGETHIGVIAQELEAEGMNGLVVEREEGYKGVKYSILFMKAIKAIQEQQTQIETLQSEINTLKGE